MHILGRIVLCAFVFCLKLGIADQQQHKVELELKDINRKIAHDEAQLAEFKTEFAAMSDKKDVLEDSISGAKAAEGLRKATQRTLLIRLEIAEMVGEMYKQRVKQTMRLLRYFSKRLNNNGIKNLQRDLEQSLKVVKAKLDEEKKKTTLQNARRRMEISQLSARLKSIQAYLKRMREMRRYIKKMHKEIAHYANLRRDMHGTWIRKLHQEISRYKNLKYAQHSNIIGFLRDLKLMWGFKETRGFLSAMRERWLYPREMRRVQLHLKNILAKLKRESTLSEHERSVAVADLFRLRKRFKKMKIRMDIEVKKLVNKRQKFKNELHLIGTQDIVISSRSQNQKKIEQHDRSELEIMKRRLRKRRLGELQFRHRLAHEKTSIMLLKRELLGEKAKTMKMMKEAEELRREEGREVDMKKHTKHLIERLAGKIESLRINMTLGLKKFDAAYTNAVEKWKHLNRKKVAIREKLNDLMLEKTNQTRLTRILRMRRTLIESKRKQLEKEYKTLRAEELHTIHHDRKRMTLLENTLKHVRSRLSSEHKREVGLHEVDSNRLAAQRKALAHVSKAASFERRRNPLASSKQRLLQELKRRKALYTREKREYARERAHAARHLGHDKEFAEVLAKLGQRLHHDEERHVSLVNRKKFQRAKWRHLVGELKAERAKIALFIRHVAKHVEAFEARKSKQRRRFKKDEIEKTKEVVKLEGDRRALMTEINQEKMQTHHARKILHWNQVGLEKEMRAARRRKAKALTELAHVSAEEAEEFKHGTLEKRKVSRQHRLEEDEVKQLKHKDLKQENEATHLRSAVAELKWQQREKSRLARRLKDKMTRFLKELKEEKIRLRKQKQRMLHERSKWTRAFVYERVQAAKDHAKDHALLESEKVQLRRGVDENTVLAHKKARLLNEYRSGKKLIRERGMEVRRKQAKLTKEIDRGRKLVSFVRDEKMKKAKALKHTEREKTLHTEALRVERHKYAVSRHLLQEANHKNNVLRRKLRRQRARSLQNARALKILGSKTVDQEVLRHRFEAVKNQLAKVLKYIREQRRRFAVTLKMEKRKVLGEAARNGVRAQHVNSVEAKLAKERKQRTLRERNATAVVRKERAQLVKEVNDEKGLLHKLNQEREAMRQAQHRAHRTDSSEAQIYAKLQKERLEDISKLKREGVKMAKVLRTLVAKEAQLTNSLHLEERRAHALSGFKSNAAAKVRKLIKLFEHKELEANQRLRTVKGMKAHELRRMMARVVQPLNRVHTEIGTLHRHLIRVVRQMKHQDAKGRRMLKKGEKELVKLMQQRVHLLERVTKERREMDTVIQHVKAENTRTFKSKRVKYGKELRKMLNKAVQLGDELKHKEVLTSKMLRENRLRELRKMRHLAHREAHLLHRITFMLKNPTARIQVEFAHEKKRMVKEFAYAVTKDRQLLHQLHREKGSVARRVARIKTQLGKLAQQYAKMSLKQRALSLQILKHLHVKEAAIKRAFEKDIIPHANEMRLVTALRQKRKEAALTNRKVAKGHARWAAYVEKIRNERGKENHFKAESLRVAKELQHVRNLQFKLLGKLAKQKASMETEHVKFEKQKRELTYVRGRYVLLKHARARFMKKLFKARAKEISLNKEASQDLRLHVQLKHARSRAKNLIGVINRRSVELEHLIRRLRHERFLEHGLHKDEIEKGEKLKIEVAKLSGLFAEFRTWTDREAHAAREVKYARARLASLRAEEAKLRKHEGKEEGNTKAKWLRREQLMFEVRSNLFRHMMEVHRKKLKLARRFKFFTNKVTSVSLKIEHAKLRIAQHIQERRMLAQGLRNKMITLTHKMKKYEVWIQSKLHHKLAMDAEVKGIVAHSTRLAKKFARLVALNQGWMKKLKTDRKADAKHLKKYKSMEENMARMLLKITARQKDVKNKLYKSTQSVNHKEDVEDSSLQATEEVINKAMRQLMKARRHEFFLFHKLIQARKDLAFYKKRHAKRPKLVSMA